MSSQQTAFLPLDAIPRAEVAAVPPPSGATAPVSLGRQFALLVLSSIALFGGLPLWLDLIAETVPVTVAGDWNSYRLLIIGGALGAIVIALIVATTWVRLVKRLARTDWSA